MFLSPIRLKFYRLFCYTTTQLRDRPTTPSNYMFFKKFLSKAAGSSNGRTPPFEGGYLGSNPGPAALDGNADKFGGVN